MTKIIFVGYPVVPLAILFYSLTKYFIKCYTARKNLKMLIDSGVKHAAVALFIFRRGCLLPQMSSFFYYKQCFDQ